MRSLLTFFLSLGVSLSAPAWKADLSSRKPGNHPPVPSSTLEFTLSWKGMLKAGELDIEFAPPGVSKPGVMVVKSSATSLGAASALFPYSHTYWSEVENGSLQSRFFQSTETDSKETVTTTNRFRSGIVSVNEVTKDLKSKAVSTQTFTFPHGPARDMFSAILHLRSQKLDVGDEHVLLLVPFKSPYLLRVRVEAKEVHLARDTIRLSFSLKKIKRDTGDLVAYKKLKKPVTLWLSDDTDRVPLELRASIYVGDVRAVLTGFTKHP